MINKIIENGTNKGFSKAEIINMVARFVSNKNNIDMRLSVKLARAAIK